MPSVTKRAWLAIGLALAVVMLPFGMMGWVIAFGGDEPLLELMAGFAIGLAIAVLGVVGIGLFWRRRDWRRLVILLAAILCLDLAWIPLGWAWNLSGRPHDRAEIAFARLQEPTLDSSGTWQGEWFDERRSFSETIVLELDQKGGRVSGSITTGSGKSFNIVEGVVSGNRLNIHYNVRSPEWPRRGGGGSLVGTVAEGSVTGTWYAHERPKRGWSRDGPWRASRVDAKRIDAQPELRDSHLRNTQPRDTQRRSTP